MMKISRSTLRLVSRDGFVNRLSAVIRARTPLDAETEIVREVVEARATRGEKAGFASEADLGLYVIAWMVAADRMEDGDLGRIAHDIDLPLGERRYGLKKALDADGSLAFGSHEALSRDPEPP